MRLIGACDTTDSLFSSTQTTGTPPGLNIKFRGEKTAHFIALEELQESIQKLYGNYIAGG